MSINSWKLAHFVLLFTVIAVWMAVLSMRSLDLHIVACDVGQGDAILIYRGQMQILVDGGPNGRVIDCLERHLPFWDRTIELVVLTHPQADHYIGLIDVFEQYGVEKFLATEADSSSKEYGVLKEVVGSHGISVVNPYGGMRVRVGLMSLDILSPVILEGAMRPIGSGFIGDSIAALQNDNKGVLGAVEYKGDLNDLSVVFQLRYGEFDGLFTGDLSPSVGKEMVTLGNVRDVEYLKVPHHGSKNGLTGELLEASRPEIAVISAGQKNRYGHPHKEVLEMLKGAGIGIERTDLSSDIEVVSDGERFWVVE